MKGLGLSCTTGTSKPSLLKIRTAILSRVHVNNQDHPYVEAKAEKELANESHHELLVKKEVHHSDFHQDARIKVIEFNYFEEIIIIIKLLH